MEFNIVLLLIGEVAIVQSHVAHHEKHLSKKRLRYDSSYGKVLFDGKSSKNVQTKKSEREEYEGENRRRGPTAKYNQSSSYEVRLHYNESLEFYRRSRQMQPLVDDYLRCVNETARLYERSGRITSRAMMKLVGQDVVLKCRDW